MKIEKISDNQIRILLNQNDLSKRDIKLSELAYGSDKTQELFKEMMDEAMKEHGFYADNTPLIIEAVPISLDSIMIIVTKVDENDKENKLKLLTQNRDLRKFKKKLLDNEEEEEKYEKIMLYSFTGLDQTIQVSERLSILFEGNSQLFKYVDKYFLFLENSGIKESKQDLELIEVILNEYGEKHISSELSKYFLNEHGQVMIENNAIEKLALLAK